MRLLCFNETRNAGHVACIWTSGGAGLRQRIKLGVAGKIMTPRVATELLEAGADFVLIGRAAILHHDFAMRALADRDFEPAPLPVTADYLAAQGLGARFLRYMATWDGFVAKAEA